MDMDLVIFLISGLGCLVVAILILTWLFSQPWITYPLARFFNFLTQKWS